jgi:hypothetical protein
MKTKSTARANSDWGDKFVRTDGAQGAIWRAPLPRRPSAAVPSA